MNAALAQLETLLVEYVLGLDAGAQHEQGRIGKRFLEPVARALVEMSDTFTRTREALPRNYWRGPGRDAYLLYYLPVNFAKACLLLNELSAHPQIFHPASCILHPFRVLDVGCGPGTASLATLFFLARLESNAPLRVEFTLVDASAAALKEAEVLLRKTVALVNRERTVLEPTIRLHVGTLADAGKFPVGGKASLVWAGNVLNEIAATDDCAGWLKDLLDTHLAADGSAIFFEPALKETTRKFMQVRDEVLRQAPDVNVFSPCTAEGECRMLRDGAERDWCHSHPTWERSRLVAQLDELTGLRKTSLKFSYLILRRDGLRLHATLTDESTQIWRLVGDVVKDKGRERVLICGEHELMTLVRLKRDRRPANQAFSRIERGQLLNLRDGHPSKQRSELNVTSNTVIEAHGPFLKF